MNNLQAKQLNSIAWTVSAVVAALAVIAWGQDKGWELQSLSLYQVFPLLGLLAFSLMWSHYIVAALRKYAGLAKGTTARYFRTTSYIVLAALLLHPGLLGWQLWQDDAGLPPQSFFEYVSKASQMAIFSGIIALLVFLAYELYRKFGDRPWWRFVQYGSDFAMISIYLHALRLGGELEGGWYLGVWCFYGITLLGSLYYLYTVKTAK